MRLLLVRNTFIALSSSIMISEHLRVLSRQMYLRLRFAMMYVYWHRGHNTRHRSFAMQKCQNYQTSLIISTSIKKGTLPCQHSIVIFVRICRKTKLYYEVNNNRSMQILSYTSPVGDYVPADLV